MYVFSFLTTVSFKSSLPAIVSILTKFNFFSDIVIFENLINYVFMHKEENILKSIFCLNKSIFKRIYLPLTMKRLHKNSEIPGGKEVENI